MNLLRLAGSFEADEATKQFLETLQAACDTCQRVGPTPVRFKVSLPNEQDIKLGDEFFIDVMFLDGKAVLYVIDTATRLSSAIFLDAHAATYGQSIEGIWLAFVKAWCILYTGLPNRLLVDQGFTFTSDRWREITSQTGIQLRISGVKAHSSLGIGERLHGPPRNIYRKVRADFPDASPFIVLKIAVKPMNNTIGENGLVSSPLLFRIVPRFPIIST